MRKSGHALMVSGSLILLWHHPDDLLECGEVIVMGSGISNRDIRQLLQIGFGAAALFIALFVAAVVS